MTTLKIARVTGDGTAPELMAVACPIIEEAAAHYDDIQIKWIDAPMGWAAYQTHGDTYPESSRDIARNVGTVFFGGVGDQKLDRTIGERCPAMCPEGRALLGLRQDLGLLVNGRPLRIPYDLRDSAKVRPEYIPPKGVNQWWMRYLPEDGYYGTRDLIGEVPEALRERLGIKLKGDVTGREPRLTELAYFTRERVEAFARFGFSFARDLNARVLDVHKANILARSRYWKLIVDGVRRDEFPGVPLGDFFIDAATSKVYEPATFNAVMLCGNEHGDIISDTALGAFSMGMMSSFSINPETGAGLFESGAGTCPELTGLDVANPIGRILTGALMLRYGRVKALDAAYAIERAVWTVLEHGWRTQDIVSFHDEPGKLIGTKEMGKKILSLL